MPGPQVVGYVANPKERARVTGALRGWALALWVGSLAELPERVREASPPPLAAIVAPHDTSGGNASTVIRQLLRTCPDTPVIAHCHTGVTESVDIRTMSEAGVHEFMFVGVDDAGMAIRSVIASAQRACAAARVSAALTPLLPERLAHIAHACLMHPEKGRTVAGLAAVLGVHRKTLLNQCAHVGGPAPSELIGWCRLMLAAHLQAATGQTVEWVALELNYPSATALRNAMKRYTGLRARQVLDRGGLATVLQAFVKRLPGAG